MIDGDGRQQALYPFNDPGQLPITPLRQANGEWLRLEIHREGKVWFQEYRRGVPQAPLVEIGESDRTGTKISFKPDHEIFTNTEYSYDILTNRLRDDFGLPGVPIRLTLRKPKNPYAGRARKR